MKLLVGDPTIVDMGYWLFAVGAMPNGDIVVTGGNNDNNGYARFTSFSPSLDVLWNIELPVSYLQFNSLAAAGDGSILAVGNDWADWRMVVANLTADGTLTRWAHLTLDSTVSLSTGVPLSDGFLVVGDDFVGRFRADLSTVWSKRLEGAVSIGSVATTSDGGFALVGSVGVGENLPGYERNYDLWAMKVSGEGSIVWQTILGGADSEEGTSVAVTSTGDIAVGGGAHRPLGSPYGGDAFLALLSGETGALQWMRTYGASGAEDSGAAIMPHDDGSLTFLASMDGLSATAPAAWFINVNGSGLTSGCSDPTIGATPPISGEGAISSASGSLALVDHTATLADAAIPEAITVTFAPTMTVIESADHCAAPP
jgi:hypothetical protein